MVVVVKVKVRLVMLEETNKKNMIKLIWRRLRYRGCRRWWRRSTWERSPFG